MSHIHHVLLLATLTLALAACDAPDRAPDPAPDDDPSEEVCIDDLPVEFRDDCAVPCCRNCDASGHCSGCQAMAGACSGTILACVGGCWSGAGECEMYGTANKCCMGG